MSGGGRSRSKARRKGSGDGESGGGRRKGHRRRSSGASAASTGSSVHSRSRSVASRASLGSADSSQQRRELTARARASRLRNWASSKEPGQQTKASQRRLAAEKPDLFGKKPETEGSALWWRSVAYQRKEKDGSTRMLLNGIDGIVRSGEMLAIMGASGGGKTTMLDFLAGRIAYGAFRGKAMYGGAPLIDTAPGTISYTMQDDRLDPVLTVRETLWYGADLSLPPSVSQEQKEARVDEVIETLGLLKARDTRIGDNVVRGVSGGERRRVSIGMGMLTKPAVLFLDEPTSGLDSQSALSVASLLRDLADQGRIVITAIHQPSAEIFNLFDKVLLLTGGRPLYFGKVSYAKKYFRNIGLPVPSGSNPADHYVAMAHPELEAERGEGQELTSRWKTSKENRAAKLAITAYDDSVPVEDEAEAALQAAVRKEQYANTMIKETSVLMRRRLKSFMRSKGFLWTRVASYIMLAVVQGTMFNNLGTDDQQTIYDRNSVLFFSVQPGMMSVSALPVFLLDKAIYISERANGFYRPSSFALSYALVTLPFMLLFALLFSSILYPIAGFNSAAGKFPEFVLTLFLSLYTAESAAVMISAVVPNFIMGISGISGIIGLDYLVGGFLKVRSRLPAMWRPLNDISMTRMVLQAFVVSEFEGLRFPCKTSEAGPGCYCINEDLNDDCELDTREILSHLEYSNVSVRFNQLSLVIMALVYRLLFYLFLRVFNSGKR